MGEQRYSYVYLHENGSLIFKRDIVVDSIGPEEYFDSPFVLEYWKIDLNNRGDAYGLLIKAKMRGAKNSEIKGLMQKWEITDDDSIEFAKRSGIVLAQRKDNENWVAGGEPRTESKKIFDAIYKFFVIQSGGGCNVIS